MMLSRSRKYISFISSLVVLAFLALLVQSSYASSSSTRRWNARQYSYDWALSYNVPEYPAFSYDCQNFVSQAMHEGGEYPKQWEDPKWFMQRTFWWYEWSHSWTVVGDFRSMLHARGWGEWWGYQAYGSSNNAWYGDAIVYDWDSNGSWDHVSMESVYYGTDPDSGWTGDLVNAHNTNRRNAIWHLRPYNSDWQTTVYGVWHIKYE